MGEAVQCEAEGADYRDPPPFEVEAQGLHLRICPDGKDRLDALLSMIGDARESLRLCFYIYSPDATGARVRDALVAAARRGVKVTLLVDGFGAKVREDYFADLIEAGGEFCCFIAKWSRRYLIRNHQKIVIADGETAMLGGFNIEDSYFAPPAENGWNDIGFTVRGPVVDRIADWFEELLDWTTRPHAQFRSIRRKVRTWDSGSGPVQLLIGGPTKGMSSWARMVSRDLIAGQRLDMMMAYFSPPYTLLRRIRRIARRGKARLILAGKSDNAATIGASRALYGGMLKAGAEIHEFQPCKLHAKVMVIDDAVYLGSANFDMRSLYLNLEIVLRIEDAAFAERMRQFIAEHLDASLAVTRQVHRQRATPLTRLRWLLSWTLVSVVDYTVSRRLNLGLG